MEPVSTSPEGELSELTPATRTGPQRMLFIDNIRWTMTLLVLSMHATDTYSPFGNWYYTDRSQTTLTTALIFGSYQSVLQAFFDDGSAQHQMQEVLNVLVSGYYTRCGGVVLKSET
jgi:hypothetical protein